MTFDLQSPTVTIEPPAGPLRGRVSPPGSKSITNRALLLAGLARGASRLTGALKSDDTRLMADALRAMGVAIDEPDDTSFVVTGDGRLCAPDGALFLGNAGTATRFLTAAVATVDGTVVVDGDAHMRKRPHCAVGRGAESTRHRRRGAERLPTSHGAGQGARPVRPGVDRRRLVQPICLSPTDDGGAGRG